MSCTAKYYEHGFAKYRPLTELAGDIAKDSVSLIPVWASMSIRLHIVNFSVWSG